MQSGELAVGILHRDLDRALGIARRAADVGNGVFETTRQHDLRARLRAGHLVAQGLALCLDVVLHENTASAAIYIDLEIDLREDRSVHFADGRGVNRKHRRERIGVLTGHDLQQRLTLALVGVLVDEREHLAMTFVDRSRPFENGGNPQAVQPGLAMMAFVDLDPGHRVAVTLVGETVELAVAAVRAGAVDQFATLDFPRCHGDSAD